MKRKTTKQSCNHRMQLCLHTNSTAKLNYQDKNPRENSVKPKKLSQFWFKLLLNLSNYHRLFHIKRDLQTKLLTSRDFSSSLGQLRYAEKKNSHCQFKNFRCSILSLPEFNSLLVLHLRTSTDSFDACRGALKIKGSLSAAQKFTPDIFLKHHKLGAATGRLYNRLKLSISVCYCWWIHKLLVFSFNMGLDRRL